MTDNKDPYDTPEERAEIDPKRTGLFSTMREIHIGIRGLFSGFKTLNPNNLASCPEEWKDEGQYWDGMSVVGWCLKVLAILGLLKIGGVPI